MTVAFFSETNDGVGLDETGAFGEDEDIMQVLEKFFKRVDTDRDQKLSSDEIRKALGSSQPNSASDRLENFKRELGKCEVSDSLSHWTNLKISRNRCQLPPPSGSVGLKASIYPGAWRGCSKWESRSTKCLKFNA